MGACEVSGIIEGVSAREALQDLFDRCGNHYDEYGEYDAYAGTPDLVNFRSHYVYGVEKWSDKKISDYIQKRLMELGKRDGEIIDLGISKYRIYTPEVEDLNPRYKDDYDYMHHLFLKNRNGENAIIVYQKSQQETGYRYYARGSVAEMKRIAEGFLVKNQYKTPCILVTRNRVIIYAGTYKEQKTCKRKSSGSTLIVPIHRYVYYGLAPC